MPTLLTETDTVTYALTQADMDTFGALLRAQTNIGPAQSSAGLTQLWNFYGAVQELIYDHYRIGNSAKLKGWMESVFSVLNSTNTNYSISGKNITATGMFTLYMYYQFNQGGLDNDGYPTDSCGMNGYPGGYGSSATWLYGSNPGLGGASPWNWFGPGGTALFQAPHTNLDFYNAMSAAADLMNLDLSSRKASTETVYLMTPGPTHTMAQVQDYTQKRFDPANWTNSSTFLQAFADSSLWSDQKTTLQTIIKADELDGDSYIFLLYLLAAMSSSSTADQTTVSGILNTSTQSIEYPNDTFSNQLVYFAMIQLVDPLGTYAYSSAQLKTFLNSLASYITVSNATAQILLKSLQNHLKILGSDSSYPMQDPYSPYNGFDTRQTDTLAALDTARATMSV